MNHQSWMGDVLHPRGGPGNHPILSYLHQQQTLSREYVCRHQESNHRRALELEAAAPSNGTRSSLPLVLSCSTDEIVLSKFQVFLRRHMEAFAATSEDVISRIRGRHKQVLLHQVGIRCRHCAHIAAHQRTKGAVYFPSSTMGIYQAAQNMCTTHLQCGLCPEMPESIKTEFALLIGTKTAGSSSSGGRAYWARCARQLGLVDTEKGIFAVGTIPEEIAPL
jgi:hypothetical protein